MNGRDWGQGPYSANCLLFFWLHYLEQITAGVKCYKCCFMPCHVSFSLKSTHLLWLPISEVHLLFVIAFEGCAFGGSLLAAGVWSVVLHQEVYNCWNFTWNLNLILIPLIFESTPWSISCLHAIDGQQYCFSHCNQGTWVQDLLISCSTYVPVLLQNAGSGLCKLQESGGKKPSKM